MKTKTYRGRPVSGNRNRTRNGKARRTAGRKGISISVTPKAHAAIVAESHASGLLMIEVADLIVGDPRGWPAVAARNKGDAPRRPGTRRRA